MKKVILLFGLFMMVSIVEANDKGISTTIRVENNYNEAISFVENGVRFHVFLNGDFDFNARSRRALRPRIFRDYKGRINRVGNVYIRYNFRGDVSRIGTVYMSYRRGRLARIGDLRITYNRWGNPRYYGQVKNGYYDYYNNDYNVNLNLQIGPVYSYNDPFFARRNFRTNYYQFREDNNFYYYRANRNAKVKGKKIIKRRKFTKGKKRKKSQGKRRRS